MSKNVLKVLDICDKLSLDYMITLDSGFKVELTPTHYINNDMLYVYDEGWDIVDEYKLSDIIECVPIFKNRL